MNTPFVFKKCSKCGRWLVANTFNFYKDKGGKYGLKSDCKECVKARNREYRRAHKEEHKEECPDGYKKCTKCGRILEANTDNFYKCKRGKYGLNGTCKECRNTYGKNHYKENKEEILERQKKYNKEHKEERNAYAKDWHKTDKGRASSFNSSCKRRQREGQQGKGINTDQWVEMMKFFGWKCAYSGINLNRDNRTIDHIIPLAKDGAHEIWNMVPMYSSYNFSKQDKDIEEWYPEQDYYNEDRVNKIYEWCKYAYNKWGKEEKI